MRNFLHKYLKHGLCFFLSAVLALGCMTALCPTANAEGEDTETVRVGLFYGSSTLISANLQNQVGEGYSFGYFNSDRQFVSLCTTDEIKITMAKDTNLYVCSSVCYESEPSASYARLGAYHIQCSESFSTYEEAAKKAAEFEGGFPAYVNGCYVVRFGNYTSVEAADAAKIERGFSEECTIVGKSSTAITVIVTGTNHILFEFDMNNLLYFGVMPRCEDGKAKTWFKGYRYFGGFQYARLAGYGITVVNFVSMADYLNGVISHEMSASWPLEALKAQTVCARTYVSKVRHSTYGFDVCNTTCCQVYYGVYDSTDYENVNRAISETAGMRIYYNGSMIDAVYHSACGGATEDAVNVWGSEVAYLKGVECPFEPNDSSWSYTYTKSEFVSLLKKHGSSCSDISDVSVSYTEAGNVFSITITDTNGKVYTYSRAKVVTMLGLRSQRFELSFEDTEGTALYVNNSSNSVNSGSAYVIDSSGKSSKLGTSVYALTSGGTEKVAVGSSGVSAGSRIIIKGSGWGHNVGMCQWGANGMARQGYTYDEILRYYYTGVSIY